MCVCGGVTGACARDWGVKPVEEVLSREVGTTEIEKNQREAQKGWYRM